MAIGFLYVLINPSMPGLAKVGKTTRDPTSRVSELSSATGVPTPFILAYQQPVDDCHFAEQWVHSVLERNGHRAADNREFFTAPLHEIVRVVSEAASVKCPTDNEATEDVGYEANPKSMGLEQYNLAMSYFSGTETSLPNEQKGRLALEHSSVQGFNPASELLGTGYKNADFGCEKDLEKALGFYLRSVDQGSWWCLAGAAEVFEEAGKVEIADRYWTRFFEIAAAFDDAKDSDENDELSVSQRAMVSKKIGVYGLQYCERAFIYRMREHCVPDAQLIKVRRHLISGIELRAAALATNVQQPEIRSGMLNDLERLNDILESL